MSRVLVVGEDALCCALGERLVAATLPGWSLARESVNTRGITRLVPRLPDFILQARHVQPVICIADSDRGCPVELIGDWMMAGGDERFVLRLAVKEAEGWRLSDAESFYAAETASRRSANAPPFGRYAAIIVSSEKLDEAVETARLIGRSAPSVEGVSVYGPAPAPLAMLRGRHRQRLLVHAKRSLDVQDVIRDWLGALKWPTGYA